MQCKWTVQEIALFIEQCNYMNSAKKTSNSCFVNTAFYNAEKK